MTLSSIMRDDQESSISLLQAQEVSLGKSGDNRPATNRLHRIDASGDVETLQESKAASAVSILQRERLATANAEHGIQNRLDILKASIASRMLGASTSDLKLWLAQAQKKETQLEQELRAAQAKRKAADLRKVLLESRMDTDTGKRSPDNILQKEFTLEIAAAEGRAQQLREELHSIQNNVVDAGVKSVPYLRILPSNVSSFEVERV